jgi:alkanesulfonate monooxygenase SsuD/methylene tetrahydromethanopterin reductase-like flavin-dependent oxidoreductase (luciferase family)
VRLGATLAHLSAAPQYPVAQWARRLVSAGFESLWTPEVIGRGLQVPDPFVALAAAATATEGSPIELGTATVQLPLHHPADLAHRVRSLAAVCGGRLSLGVSPGSTAADYALVDQDFARRFSTFDQHLARVRTLLDVDDAGHLPHQLGAAPPLLLGSWGARVERAAQEFDGWLASGYRSTPDQIVAAHARYRAAGGLRAIVCAIPLAGNADLAPTREALNRYAEAGFDDAVVLIQPGGPDPAQVRALFP